MIRLYDAGYRDILPVIPPGAELSPGSKIDPTQRGKAPGKKYPNGWGGWAWAKADPPTRDEVLTWAQWGANVGMRGRSFPGLDIDSSNARFTAVVETLARRYFGEAPTRYSVGERRLLVYRSETPLRSRRLTCGKAGQQQLVEFLADGKQYVIQGRHPSGAEYRFGRPLWTFPAQSLPVLTEEAVEEFFGRLRATLEAAGWEVWDRTASAAEDAPPIEHLRAPSLEKLRELPLPPNPEHYGWDEFIRHGYAYRAASDEDPELGFELWVKWAEQHPKFDLDVCRHEWSKGFANPRVGWGWLMEQAEASGDYVSAVDEFEADPAMAGAGPDHDETLRYFMRIETLYERPELLEPPECVIPRLAYRGRLTILAGPDKGGKSTLTSHALAAHAKRERFLGEECGVKHGLAVLMGLEEALGDPVRRFHELGVEGNLIMVAQPDRDLLAKTRAFLHQMPADVLVIDSLQEYARVVLGSAPEDGDNSGWAKVVRPLVQLARDRDIAVVVLHHVRRADGRARGASEILAAADALLEMEEPKAYAPRSRRITGRGRWPVEPFTVTLGEGGYTLETEGVQTHHPLDLEITKYIEGNPGSSTNAIRESVMARKSEVSASLTRLLARGAIVNRGTEKKAAYYIREAADDFTGSVDDLA